MPQRLQIEKGFINNQSINTVVGLNIAYSNSIYGAKNFPSAYASANPLGIAFDKFGNLWVADNGRPAIIMYPTTNQYNGAPATFIINQPNLNVNNANPVIPISQSNMNSPINIAFDNNNNLWVADHGNNRILGFKYPFGSGGILNASWVIGQPNFTSTLTGLSSSLLFAGVTYFCFDNNNNLWVSDSGNNRILGFSAANIYTTGGAQASWVIGQPNFTSNTVNNGGIGAETLNGPRDVKVDKNGNLWVVDLSNYRVLGYSNPNSIMPAANYLIGQPNFTTSGSSATQNTLFNPTTMAFDNNNNLWIYDFYRILGFSSSSLYGIQPNASWLMFQSSYTAELTSTLNQGHTMLYDNAGFFYSVPMPNENIVAAKYNPYQIDLSYPLFLAFDSNNNIWISDTGYFRVLQYLNPTQNTYPYNCSTVLAQSQYYIQGISGITQYELDYVSDIAIDNNKNIWCADSSRIVGYQYPNYNQQVMQNWVIGAPNFTTLGGNTQSGIINPRAITFDNYGNLFAADNTYNRILGFSANTLYGNNQPNAFVVIGQGSYTTSSAATTQNGLNIDIGNVFDAISGKMAFDSSNNMYVCDTVNNRIMIYIYGTGFTVGMNAGIVLGQASFTTATAGTGAANLNTPTYCIFDKSGNLWVSDRGNNRVQKFVPPFTIGMSASISITGFSGPVGLVFDISGNLLVADNLNNRILLFTPASITTSTTVASASIVLGQPNMTTVTSGIGTNKLNYPLGLAIDSLGGLLCADNNNNRIVHWAYKHKETLTDVYNSKYVWYNE